MWNATHAGPAACSHLARHAGTASDHQIAKMPVDLSNPAHTTALKFEEMKTIGFYRCDT